MPKIAMYALCTQTQKLLFEFSTCGGLRTNKRLSVLTAYCPVLAQGHLGKGGLFVTPPLEDCPTELRANLPELELVVRIYSLSMTVLLTAKHWPDITQKYHKPILKKPPDGLVYLSEPCFNFWQIATH